MSRKRASSASAAALVRRNGAQCPNMEEYEYEYYRPGCYCTPQVVRHATPYTCAYLHEYLPQWTTICNPATYVVDTYGMVYYLSDFEYQLQLPGSVNVETEITYHYYDKNEHDCLTEDEEEGAVSPRKRERFNCDNDSETPADTVKMAKSANKSRSVYRTEQGYLVEEPTDESDAAQPKD